MTPEGRFKKQFKDNLRRKFGCEKEDYFKSDIRSMPDTLVIIDNKPVYLEFKRSIDAPHQQNQEYHIDRLNMLEGSFARFVYPENAEEVLDEIAYYIEDFKL